MCPYLDTPTEHHQVKRSPGMREELRTALGFTNIDHFHSEERVMLVWLVKAQSMSNLSISSVI